MMRLMAVALLPFLLWSRSAAADSALAEQAEQALSRAVRYFREEVSVHGSYLWTYSADLQERRGEEEATATQGWVQPPGTPSVGMAYLAAYRATNDPTYRDAAREVVMALYETQLASGGWDYRIEFDPEARKRWWYRSDVERGDLVKGRRRNTSTYDDNTTQSALRFLMEADAAFGETVPEARHAVEYGLAKLLDAQYPNGAWPQRYSDEDRNVAEYPIRKARYPDEWSRTYPRVRYRDYYTFNDNAIRDIILTFLAAHRQYGKPAYLDAAKRGGDFILLAQMPEPQPVWAQQYNPQMEPAWARKFEPPSVTAGESSGVVRTLIDLYLDTGDERYIDAVPPALDWFRRSALSDGRWARFYELRTNRPLYFTTSYELVYTDDDLPTHYSFQGGYGISRVIEYAEEVIQQGREATLAARNRTRTPEARRAERARMEPTIREIIAAQDEQGRWVENGLISVRSFNRNVEALAEYLALSAD